MLNFALPVTTEVDGYNGFMDGLENIKTKRLANYKAMQEIGKAYADSGTALDTEQWANISKSVLGPAAFLTSTAPSSDMLNALASQQSAAAKIKAEELRRSQFKADQEEKKAAEADVKARYLAGDNDAQVDEYVRNMYGEERAAALRPNLGHMRQTATHEGTLSGVDFGSKMFQTTDEAEAYLAENGSHLSEFEKTGIKTGAAANQQKTEAVLEQFAIDRGNSGFIGDANDELAFQNRVKLAFPKATTEQVDAMTKRFMKTAMAAAQAKQVAEEDKAMIAVRQARMAAYPREQAEVATLRQGEIDRRNKEAKALEQGFEAGIARQDALAKELKGKGTKMTDADKEILAGLNSYVFKNPDEYVAAVAAKDQKAIARLKAESLPIAEYVRNAQNLGQAIAGSFDNVDQLLGFLRSSGLGPSKVSLATLGKEMASQEAFTKQPGTRGALGNNSSAVDRALNRITGAIPSAYITDGGVDTSSPSGADMRAAAKANVEHVRKSFVEDTANYIKDVRAVIEKNRGIGVTSEELAAREKVIITEKVRHLMSGYGDGTGQRNIEMETSLVLEIMNAVGKPQTYVKQETPADAYIRSLDESYKAMMTRSGTIPGTVRQNPRLAQPF